MQNMLFTSITTAFFVGLSLLYSTDANLVSENGLYENLQALLLLLTFALALIGALRHTNPTLKYTLTGFALLSFAFLLRELEFRGGHLPDWLIYVTAPQGSAYITLLAFIPFVYYSLKNLSFALHAVICFCKSLHVLRILLVASLLVLGGVFDRNWIFSAHAQFFEEFFELAAYYALAWSMFKLLPNQIEFEQKQNTSTSKNLCFG